MSEHSSKVGWVVLFLLFIGVFGYALYYKQDQTSQPTVTLPPSQTFNAGLPMEKISIGTHTLHVEVATTDPQREQGLSSRTSLEDGKGMLFIFDPARAVGFWMKDMKFSLDMIFAQDDGTIIKIAQNVSPDTYPNVIPSGAPIRYVLEVPAGYSAQQGIAIGQKIVVQ